MVVSESKGVVRPGEAEKGDLPYEDVFLGLPP
jgi:hypothetical protein